MAVRWAGRILLSLGTLHLVVMGAQNTKYFGDFFNGALWGQPREEFIHPAGAGGAFWVSVGSFAVPLILLGVLVLDLARREVAVPAVIGWGVAAWGILGAAIMEPTPMILLVVPAVLLIRAAAQDRPRSSR